MSAARPPAESPLDLYFERARARAPMPRRRVAINLSEEDSVMHNLLHIDTV